MKKSLNILAFALLLTGCTYDKQEELYPSVIACDTSGASYSGKVSSIIQANCNSCHSSALTSGNVNLEGHANLKVYADNGKLSGAINHRTGYTSMPQGGSKMNDCDIQVIEKWISDGSPNN